MKTFLLVFLLLSVTPAFAQLSDRTGLLQHFTIETGGYDFEVAITANLNVQQLEFSAEEKKLTMHMSSELQNNLAEIQIPTNLINGNFTFFLNDQEIFPNVQTNEKISFITVEFEGDGIHKLDIIGTTYLPEFANIIFFVLSSSLIGVLILTRLGKFSFYDYS